MTVIVVSDTHLGYERSNAADFFDFLNYLDSRSDVKTLVILGDFVDMWRRDVSGLFLEVEKITHKLLELGKKIELVFVAGNHDYHLLQLKGNQYPFKFEESKIIAATQTTHYKLKHGYEYDLAQNKLVMEALCHNLSNELGQDRSKIYDFFMEIKDAILHLLGLHGGSEGYLAHLMAIPETRLAKTLPDIEKRASEDIRQNEILVFGHTHRAFVSADGRLANSGCWVGDASIQNTFVELDGERVRLFQFSKGAIVEIKERLRMS